MKKLSMFILALASMLLFMNCSVPETVYAEEAEEEVLTVIDSAEGLDEEQFVEENNRLLALGKQLRMRRQSTICALANFPKLYQGDVAWKDCIMRKRGLAIGSAGCCLTSFTMIQQYYGGTDTPDLVNETLGIYACDFTYGMAAQYYDYTITVQRHLLNGASVSYEDTVDYVWGAIW